MRKQRKRLGQSTPTSAPSQSSRRLQAVLGHLSASVSTQSSGATTSTATTSGQPTFPGFAMLPSYAHTSLLQAQLAAPAHASAVERARSLGLKQSSSTPFRFVDFGCSVGNNSCAPIAAVIQAYRSSANTALSDSTTTVPVEVVLVDQPLNDFAAMWRIIAERKESFTHLPDVFTVSSLHFFRVCLCL